MKNLCLLVTILAVVVSAEEMNFFYQLPQGHNICFLQNIAENIQGNLML